MKRITKFGVVATATVAMVAAMGAAAVPAMAGQGAMADGTSWTVPTQAYVGGDTVNVDGKDYKVITTWANAWALSGPDYLGVSNSGVMNQNGGAAGTEALKTVQTSQLLGIWASAANEVPNAYNWNFFYNLYAADQGYDKSAYSDLAATNVTNGEDATFDSTTGVYGPLKYRPEVIWTSNSFSSAQAATYTALVRAGKYYNQNNKYMADGSDGAASTEAGVANLSGVETAGRGGAKTVSYTFDEDSSTPATNASDYYIAGDENYDPEIINPNSTTAFTFGDSFYNLADIADKIIAKYADANGNGLADTLESDIPAGTKVTGDNATIKTMNYLPRTTRYEASSENAMTAQECALEYEKVTKGSIYYVLSQLKADGKSMKKVAWLTGDPDTTGNTATVVAFDTIDAVGLSDDNGYASFAPLVTDQLTSDTPVTENKRIDGNFVQGNYITYTTYTVTADELATCDAVMLTSGGGTNGSSGLTAETLKQWVIDKATTTEAKESAAKAQYATTAPAMMNAHNYTVEKTIFGVYNMCFLYPEYFPNMELVAYWYDNIYHLNASAVKTAMQWALGNVSLPDGVELAKLSDEYSSADINNKIYQGMTYYKKSESAYARGKSADTVIEGLLSDTGRISGAACDGSDCLPSDTLIDWVDDYSSTAATAEKDAAVKAAQDQAAAEKAAAVATAKASQKAQNLAINTSLKTVKCAKGKKKLTVAKTTAKIAVTGAQGKLTYVKKAGSAKLSIVSATKGFKVKVKKGTKKGTYKIKVMIKAAAKGNYKATTSTVFITVVVK